MKSRADRLLHLLLSYFSVLALHSLNKGGEERLNNAA